MCCVAKIFEKDDDTLNTAGTVDKSLYILTSLTSYVNQRNTQPCYINKDNTKDSTNRNGHRNSVKKVIHPCSTAHSDGNNETEMKSLREVNCCLERGFYVGGEGGFSEWGRVQLNRIIG